MRFIGDPFCQNRTLSQPVTHRHATAVGATQVQAWSAPQPLMNCLKTLRIRAEIQWQALGMTIDPGHRWVGA
tara:strand:+ start:1708 stop:1923 length:216 start_codon:yes stop_codon:yes gene_type:complete